MAHQSLYRRYRPQRFAEIRGQDHLVRALRNAVDEGRVGHAYLLSGPRGTGKTTTARILAKALNCAAVTGGEPCGVCDSCRSIEDGGSFDVHELDAASNNRVEAIRDLVAHAALGTPGRRKVYILDEVHMLSTGASNALLKTLEEPPAHVVFVLATTDPQEVLPTIRSRCQHFEVHLIPADVLDGLVRDVATDAGIPVTEEMVAYVVRQGGGSARDTLSLLDQVAAAGGIPDDDAEALDDLVEALAASDTRRALLAVEHAVDAGRNPRLLGESLIARLRDVFLVGMGVDLPRLSDLEQERVAAQASALGAARATRAIEAVGEAFVGIADAPDQRIPLDVALVRLTRPEADTSVSALAERVERLERAVAGRAPVAPIAQDPPGPVGAPPVRPEGEPGPPANRDDMAVPTAPGQEPSPPPVPVADDAGAPRRSRPADAARAALARTTGPTRSAGPARAGRGSDRRTPPVPQASRPSATEELPASSAPADPTPATVTPAPAAPGPVRPAVEVASTAPHPAGEIDLAAALGVWESGVLDQVPRKVRMVYAPLRPVATDGATVIIGAPNDPHMQRCAAGRLDVESALSAALGRPASVRLVIHAGGDADPPPGAPAPAPEPDVVAGDDRPPRPALRVVADIDEPPDDEIIDPDDLIDATDAASSQQELVMELFPGAEAVPVDDPPS